MKLLVRATGTTSIGTGVMVQQVVLTHKSNVRMVCHIKQSTTGGTTNIRIPFDSDFGATPVRKMTSIFMDDAGLANENDKKLFVVMSGASGVGYVYGRTQ